MEWSGSQQLIFLSKSLALGIIQGLLWDVVLSVSAMRSRGKRFVMDALVGVPCALLTMFGALVIMDGQLHPLLLFGVLMGMALEHFSLGRLIRKVLRMLCSLRRCLVGVVHRLRGQSVRALDRFKGFLFSRCMKIHKRREKT